MRFFYWNIDASIPASLLRLPASVVAGLWMVLASVIASLATRRRLPAALLTGVLGALWPLIEVIVADLPLYQHFSERYYQLLSYVYRRRHGRRIEEAEELRRDVRERYGMDMEGLPVQLLQLRRVIPIGQMQRIDGGTFMFLALESYLEGFLVHARILLDEVPEALYDPEVHGVYVEPILVITDDRGAHYPVIPAGWFGDPPDYRHDFQVNQPLHPDARELRLEMPEIHWVKDERYGPRTERVATGPWTFTVAL